MLVAPSPLLITSFPVALYVLSLVASILPIIVTNYLVSVMYSWTPCCTNSYNPSSFVERESCMILTWLPDECISKQRSIMDPRPGFRWPTTWLFMSPRVTALRVTLRWVFCASYILLVCSTYDFLNCGVDLHSKLFYLSNELLSKFGKFYVNDLHSHSLVCAVSSNSDRLYFLT